MVHISESSDHVTLGDVIKGGCKQNIVLHSCRPDLRSIANDIIICLNYFVCSLSFQGPVLAEDLDTWGLQYRHSHWVENWEIDTYAWRYVTVGVNWAGVLAGVGIGWPVLRKFRHNGSGEAEWTISRFRGLEWRYQKVSWTNTLWVSS